MLKKVSVILVMTKILCQGAGMNYVQAEYFFSREGAKSIHSFAPSREIFGGY
jgi:hypothetical protein